MVQLLWWGQCFWHVSAETGAGFSWRRLERRMWSDTGQPGFIYFIFVDQWRTRHVADRDSFAWRVNRPFRPVRAGLKSALPVARRPVARLLDALFLS